MKKLSIYLVLFVALFSPVHTQGAYKVPPKEVVDILDAPPTPSMIVSPCGNLMLQMEYDPMSSIAHMAQPMVQLAGLRITPRTNGRQRTLYYTGLVIQHLGDGSTRSINLPKDARLGRSKWSYDSKWLAFTLYTKKGIELWTVDVEKATAKAVTQPCVNATLGSAFQWMPDSKHVLVRMIPKSRGSAPEAPTIPDGPKIQETVGRFAKVRTYQGLLGDSHDESLFDHYTTSQLTLIDVKTGKHRKIGVPGTYHYVSSAPSGELLLVNRIKRPYSHGVPYPYFPRSVEIWNMKGEVVHVLADLPLADEMPVRGVPTGPRSVDWRPLQASTLVWVEALDEGDPKKKVPYRDKLMTIAAPFEVKPREICKIQHRYHGIDWLPTDGQGMIAEYDWERRWRTTKLVDFDDSTVEPKTIFDLSIHDRYNAPGYLIHRTMLTGRQVLLQDGDWIYLSGRGATPQGDRPFLDRMNVKTLKKERLFLSGETSFESFIAFVGNDHSHIVTRYESKTEPRNYFVRNLPNGESRALTHFENPAPQLTGLRKQLITYKRKDGINLSGTLYLPPSYQIGKRLPLVIWAYPMEYSDPGTAGQVSGSPNRFTLPRGASRLFFLTQG
jgi:dipeptidyl aminopeptidase/acylaminoacyl peptidase